MSIKTTLKAMKKDQKIVICAPKVEATMTGIVRASIDKSGYISVNYSDGTCVLRKLQPSMLEADSLSFRQIHSFLNGDDEDTGIFAGVMQRDLSKDEQDTFDSIFPERNEMDAAK